MLNSFNYLIFEYSNVYQTNLQLLYYVDRCFISENDSTNKYHY